ncbi:hypothetical protein GALMADRAFT_143989 [Galerina marginata CBS 339.88]|uniref:DUF6533 domain-containing protein n=1 Tax=Galerina marginata (strain CBS 339.88) TaxID=685588 RepID=A0A067SWZ3_GALM3|nr:hypothetical protein GALMADRAFT_143989 [Galerina marginata CBS 339.88]
MSDLTPAILQGYQSVQLVLCTRLASIVIIIYDHPRSVVYPLSRIIILIMASKVKLIWFSEWTLAKILFLTNRYFALSAAIFSNYVFFTPNLTNEMCVSGIIIQKPRANAHIFISISPIVVIIQALVSLNTKDGLDYLHACSRKVNVLMIATAILLLRLRAIYLMERRLFIAIVMFYLACSTISAWIMGTGLPIVIATTSSLPTPVGPFCSTRTFPPHFYSFWIPMLSCEIVLCTLAVVPGIRSFQANGSIFRRGLGLIVILTRDSVMYFLGVGVVYLVCLVVWITEPNALTELEAPPGFSIALSCTLGSRLILNIREAVTINRSLEIPSHFSHESQALDTGIGTGLNTATRTGEALDTNVNDDSSR